MRFPARGVPFPSNRRRGPWEKAECRRHRDRQKNTSRPARRSRPRGTAGSLQGSVFLRQQRRGLSGRDFRQPGITNDPKSQARRLGTVTERPLGADPVDPSALNSHEMIVFLDLPPSQLLNAARRPADSFDDARPATIVGRGCLGSRGDRHSKPFDADANEQAHVRAGRRIPDRLPIHIAKHFATVQL